MQFEVKDLNGHTREIEIELSAEDLAKIEQKVIKNIQKRADVPGFRKGRVPVALVKKRYADVIQGEVLDKAMSQYYSKALTEADVKPIAQGKITDVDFEDMAKGLKFKIEIEVEPEIELKKYKGLSIEKTLTKADADMVSAALLDIQKHFATVKTAEIVEEGYHVKFTAQELGEGDMPIVGRKYDDIQSEIGSGDFDEELEKQLIGLKAGEDAVVRKVSAAPGADGAPTTESYRIEIHSIEERELPPLNNDLVKNLDDDELKTLAQLKKRLKENIQADLDRRSEQEVNTRIIEELLKENPFEVPEAMINNYLENVLEDFRRRSQGQNFDEEMIRQRFRTDAIHNIRWYLLKQRIEEVESITVPDEKVFERIDSVNMGDDEKAKLKKDASVLNRLREEMMEDTVLSYLKDNAKIKEIKPSKKKAKKDTAELATS